MLLCMTACKKEENNGILRLEIEHFSSDSKLHLDAAHFAVWDNNDEVLLNGVRKPVLISNGTATISDVATADAYTAVYPSSWADKSGSTTSITYPGMQIYRENSFIAPMAAKYENRKLVFKNLGAVLAVTVNTPMTVERIEVIAEGSTPINGTAAIDFNSARPTIGTFGDDGTNKTTLVCNTEVTSSKTFYIAMPPVTAKLTIKVYGDTYCYTKTQSSSLLLQANHGYSINLNDDGFTTTSMPTNYQLIYTADTRIDDPTGLTVASHEFSNGQGTITFVQEIIALPERFLDGNEYITSIILPASVTSIGKMAFQSCMSLNTVIMPGVETIDEMAFADCNAFSVISLPNVKSISTNAFYGFDVSYLSMPKVTTIGSSAFESTIHAYCTENSVLTERYAFNNLPETARLHLPLSNYNEPSWNCNGWSGQTYWDL